MSGCRAGRRRITVDHNGIIELEGKVTIAKVNIDENPGIPTKYGVRGVPTLMIFSQGQVAATKVGALPKSKIKEWIEQSI